MATRTRPSKQADGAVSDIVGSLLLLGVAVALTTGFVLVLFNLPPPTPSAQTNLHTFIQPSAPNEIVIEHRGGPSIPLTQLTATITLNGTATQYVVGNQLGGSWRVVGTNGLLKSSTQSFVPGDQAIYTDATLPTKSADVILADAAKNAVLVGTANLQGADATAPQVTSARTTSTTTILVNFSERLRVIDKADFSVSGVTISTARLVGNGTQAEFTVSPAYDTNGQPLVNTTAAPAGTEDFAGNDVAGGASVTATDGVAPAITVGPSATGISSSGATISWTTPEAGNSIVNFGPTTLLGRTTTDGTSTSSHSVVLSSLTPSTLYFYTVTTADSGGTSVTSSQGSFSTSAAASSGSSSSANESNHLDFTAVASLTSGTISSTVYEVTLRAPNNTAVSVTSPLTINLATNSTVGYFYDPTGATINTTATIAAGQSTATFKYIDHRSGGKTVLTASASGVIPGTTTVSVSGRTNRGFPDHLEFTRVVTPLASGTLGVAGTDVFTVTLRDAQNETVRPASTLTIRLSTNSTLGYFVDELDDTVIIQSVNISTTQTSASFRYIDYRSGGVSHLLATANSTIPASTVIGVSGRSGRGPADHLEFTAVPSPLTSGTTSGTFTVTLRDSNNETTTAPATLRVDLLTNSTTGHFLDSAGTTIVTSVNITSGASTASFRYVDHRSGGATRIAAFANNTVPASAIVSVQGRTGRGAPDRLEFTGVPDAMTSGSTSGTFTITLKDANNETTVPPTGMVVRLLTNSSSGYFVNDSSGAILTSLNISIHQSTASFKYVDSRVGGVSAILAHANGTLSAMTVIGVQGGTPATSGSNVNHLEFTTVPSPLTSGTASSTDFTIQLRDSANTSAVTPSSPLTVRLATNSTSGYFLDSGGTIITSVNITGGSTATFRYLDHRSSGTSQLFAFANNTIPAAATVSIGGNTGLGVPNHLEFTAVPSPLTSGTASATDYTVTLRDAMNQTATPTSPLTVRLVTNSSFGHFLDSAGTTIITSVNVSGGATASFKYIDYRSGGVSQLTAFANNTIPATATVGVTGRSLRGIPDHLEFTAVPSPLTSGTASASDFTVTLRDANNETTVPPQTLTVRLVTNSSFGWFQDSSGTIITSVNLSTSASTASFRYIDHRPGGTTQLMAFANGTTPAVATVSIAGRSSLGGIPDNLLISGTASITSGTQAGPYTITLRDYYNREVTAPSAITVTLMTNSSSGYFRTPSTTTTITTVTIAQGASTTTFDYIDSRYGGNSVLTAVATNVVPSSLVVAVTGGSPPATGAVNRLAWTTVESSLNPGVNSTFMTITLVDSSGTVVAATSDMTVNLTTSGTGSFLNVMTNATIQSITLPNGASSVTVKYVENATDVEAVVLTAYGRGVVPGSAVIPVNLRLTAARTGATADSIVARVYYTTDVGDSLAGVIVAGSIANPTNRSFTLTSMVLTSTGITNIFASPANGASDTDLLDCDSATGGTQAPTVMSGGAQLGCNFADFTLGPYEVRQFVWTHTTPNLGAATSGQLGLTVFLGNGDPAVLSPPFNYHHTGAATPGGFTLVLRSGANDVGALGTSTALSAGSQSFTWRLNSKGATSTPTRLFVEFEIPAGWRNVNVTAPNTATTVAIRQPTGERAGFVQFASATAFTTATNFDMTITATPPAFASGGAIDYITARTDATASAQHYNSNYAFPLRFG